MMADPRRPQRSARQPGQNRPTEDLSALEHLPAPWFFEADLQRRLRSGDRRTRRSVGRPARILGLVVVVAAALVVAYLEFGDRLNDLLPAPQTPAVTRPDSTSAARPDTQQSARPAVTTTQPENVPVPQIRSRRDTIPISGEQTTAADTPAPALRTLQPAVQETSRTDSFRRPEPERTIAPPDTTHVSPDSLGRQGAP